MNRSEISRARMAELMARAEEMKSRVRESRQTILETHALVETLRNNLKNITEQSKVSRREADELQTVSRRVLEGMEVERRKIARELHDQVGQQLTCLHVLLQGIVVSAPTNLRSRLRESCKAVQEVIDTVRNLWVELRPPILDDLGLLRALEWHFKKFHKRTRIVVCLDKKRFNEYLLNDFLKNVVFRIIQEALTNVARHAETKKVKIRLDTRSGRCFLQVRDFGKGFNTAKVVKEGSGLIGMRERILLAGGELIVKSFPKRGTLLQIELPLIHSAGTASDMGLSLQKSLKIGSL